MEIDLYVKDRTDLLRQLQSVNEDFLSSIENWESYEEHLAERDSLILAIKELDDNLNEDSKRQIDVDKAKEMDNMLGLILALDRDIVEALNKERVAILKAMKVTTRGKKLANYGFGHGIHGEGQGKILNRKE